MTAHREQMGMFAVDRIKFAIQGMLHSECSAGSISPRAMAESISFCSLPIFLEAVAQPHASFIKNETMAHSAMNTNACSHRPKLGFGSFARSSKRFMGLGIQLTTHWLHGPENLGSQSEELCAKSAGAPAYLN
jgi:hypothetical protein